jgi:hypothetical protein
VSHDPTNALRALTVNPGLADTSLLRLVDGLTSVIQWKRSDPERLIHELSNQMHQRAWR